MTSLSQEPLDKSKQTTPTGVKKTPKKSAVSSHVTLSESAVDSDISVEPKQRADISHKTTRVAKTLVIKTITCYFTNTIASEAWAEIHLVFSKKKCRSKTKIA